MSDCDYIFYGVFDKRPKSSDFLSDIQGSNPLHATIYIMLGSGGSKPSLGSDEIVLLIFLSSTIPK